MDPSDDQQIVPCESTLDGQCKVAWTCVTRPSDLGGLGMLDLNTLGYALRLQWELLARVDPSQSWTALAAKPEHVVRTMFEATTSVQIGDGRQILFWQEKWLDDISIGGLVPELYLAVSKRPVGMTVWIWISGNSRVLHPTGADSGTFLHP
jgi:hypothetical protein